MQRRSAGRRCSCAYSGRYPRSLPTSQYTMRAPECSTGALFRTRRGSLPAAWHNSYCCQHSVSASQQSSERSDARLPGFTHASSSSSGLVQLHRSPQRHLMDYGGTSIIMSLFQFPPPMISLTYISCYMLYHHTLLQIWTRFPQKIRVAQPIPLHGISVQVGISCRRWTARRSMSAEVLSWDSTATDGRGVSRPFGLRPKRIRLLFYSAGDHYAIIRIHCSNSYRPIECTLRGMFKSF